MDVVDPASVGLAPATLAQLDTSVQTDIDSGINFGAAVLVARGGKVAHQANFGTVAPGRQAAARDKYLLMSMSKVYTAVLTLRAVDAGLFDLDTKVVDLEPAFGEHGKTKATVRQLLCHTSGLPMAPVAPPLPLTAMGDLTRMSDAIMALKPVYEPGTHCVYSSGTGYDLLGRILVDTDPKRRSFIELARQELFEPLGLKNTSFGLRLDDPHRVPASHTPSHTTPSSANLTHIFNTRLDEHAAWPCGAAFADIDDVFTWTEALQGRGLPTGFELVSADLLAEAKRNQTGDMPLEAMMVKGLPAIRQMAATLGVPTLLKQMVYSQLTKGSAYDPGLFPANFTLLGGYTRGTGDHLTPAGRTASPNSLAAMGGATTGWMIDPERDLTVVFLSAGFVEGYAHPKRLQRIFDLAIAAVRD